MRRIAVLLVLFSVFSTGGASAAKTIADPLSRDRRITPVVRLAIVDSCRNVDVTPRNGIATLGFPHSAAVGTPSSLRIAVLPLTFSDLPYKESDYSSLQAAVLEFKKYYETMSYGRANVTAELVPYSNVVNMPNNAQSYRAFGEYIDVGQVTHDALLNAAASLNLGSYDMVALEIARNESVKFWPVANPNSIESSSGRVGGAVLAGGWQSANWRAIAHEVGHVWLALEDLYDMSPPPEYGGTFWDYDLMNSFRGAAPELMAWHRFMLGWIVDSQIRCVTANSAKKTTHYISAIADNNSLPKAVMKPLGTGRTLVIESRRGRGYDKVEDSVLVYVVDSTRVSGDGPVEAKAELTLNKSRVPRRDPFVIPVGSSVNVEGTLIRLLASSKWGDLVQITQG